MNRRKAKRLIEQLLNELNNETIKQQFWMDKVQAYTQSIFGDHTDSIALPMFGTYYWDRPFDVQFAGREDLIVSTLKEMFAVYLIMINNGLFRKRNMFSNFNNWTIIGIVAGIVVFFIGIIGTLSYNQGGANSEHERTKLTIENKELLDSIKKLNSEIIR